MRTARHLRVAQILSRPARAGWLPIARPLLGALGGASAPRLRASFTPPLDELRRHAEREAARACARLTALGDHDAALAAYERSYGRELLAGRRESDARSALDAYPASVRARSLALAASIGVRVDAAEIAQCARAILLQLEVHLAGNHLLENGVGLVAAALVCDGAEAALWHGVGERILLEELVEQFLGDGGHFERSATYHGWILCALLELCAIHRAVGRALPVALQRAVEAALSFLRRIEPPDGSWPLFNDASLDFCPRPAELRALASALELDIGIASHAAIDHLVDTGWIVARNERAFVIADVGQVGPAYIPGHAHADTLTFELWVDGQRLVVDAGVPCYAPGAERTWCRSTSAHNTVVVDGRDSAEVWSAFRVGRRGAVRVLSAEARPRPLWSAEHDGYAHLPGRPVHRRSWTLERDALVIEDVVLGTGEHALLAALRFDQEALERTGAAATFDVATAPPVAGPWFPDHGRARRAVTLTAGGLMALPARIGARIAFGADAQRA